MKNTGFRNESRILCVARYSIIAESNSYLSIILEGVKSAACQIYPICK